jgi:hypothetical protein
MARNKVMTLWSAFVTAFLALCTTLGLITTTAAAAVPQTETPRNSDSTNTSDSTVKAHLALPVTSPWALAYAKALPPTMKQRISAEAHGKTPRCRSGALAESEASSAGPAKASSSPGKAASGPAKASSGPAKASSGPAKAPAASNAHAARAAGTAHAARAAGTARTAHTIPAQPTAPECGTTLANLELTARAL